MSADRNSAFRAELPDANELACALADTLEAIEWLERFERPYLMARYQASLGELEVRLLGLKVERRAYRSRVDLAQTRLRRGEPLSNVALASIERAVASELLAWQALEADHVRVLTESRRHPGGRPPLDPARVARVRAAWRRLACRLHPEICPYEPLTDRYWGKVEDAYRAVDAELLDALAPFIERETDAAALAITPNETARLATFLDARRKRLTRMHSQAPFCWSDDLEDPDWIADKQAALATEIEAESDALAALVLEFAGLSATTVN
jgi:hypothetical protein